MGMVAEGKIGWVGKACREWEYEWWIEKTEVWGELCKRIRIITKILYGRYILRSGATLCNTAR